MSKPKCYFGKSNQLDLDSVRAGRGLLAKTYEVSEAEPPYDKHYIKGREKAFFMVPNLAEDEEYEYCGRGLFGEIEYCLDKDIPCFFLELDPKGIFSYPITEVKKNEDGNEWKIKYGTFELDVDEEKRLGDNPLSDENEGEIFVL